MKAADIAAIRCELLLGLGDAEYCAGHADQAKATFWQAAELANSLRIAELIVRAASGLARFRAGLAIFSTVDSRFIAFFQAALDNIPDGDSSARAHLLSLLAQEMYRTDSVEERDALSREALEMARRVGEPAALSAALQARHLVIWGPDSARERLTVATEALELAQRSGDVQQALTARTWRIADLLELGRVNELDAELGTFSRLAEKTQQPFWLWNDRVIRAMRALLSGQFGDAEQLANEAITFGQQSEQGAMLAWGAQIALIRWEQGRLGEMESTLRAASEQFPEFVTLKCTLILLLIELGRKGEARSQFTKLAASEFRDLRRDSGWLGNLCSAAHISVLLDDPTHAGELYELLLPYAGQTANLGYAGFSYGAVSGYLGILAMTMGRFDEAQEHYEAGIDLLERMGAHPWVAYAEYYYAELATRLGDCARASRFLTRVVHAAKEMGMTPLMEMALALQRAAEAPV